MTTILKVQITEEGPMNGFALVYNKEGSFKKFINIEKEKSLVDILMGENINVSYCLCEVKGDTIEKVINYVTAEFAEF